MESLEGKVVIDASLPDTCRLGDLADGDVLYILVFQKSLERVQDLFLFRLILQVFHLFRVSAVSSLF